MVKDLLKVAGVNGTDHITFWRRVYMIPSRAIGAIIAIIIYVVIVAAVSCNDDDDWNN